MIPMLRHETIAPTDRRALLGVAMPTGVGLAAGTRVETLAGVVAVEDLVPGMLLDTTAGPQPVLRVLVCRPGMPSAAEQVMLPAGTVGRGLPLVLAAEQEIVVTGWIAELHFGADSVVLTPEMLRRAGVAQAVAGTDEQTLYLPVVAAPCAVYAGAIALTLGCAAPDAALQDSALPGSIELSDAEAALVMSLLGTKTLH